EWNEETQTVTAIQGKTTIKFSIGKNEMYVNDKVICLDAPVRISNGRTFIPLRAVAEAFDAKVDWNEDLKLITITY
ncbi:MAG: copper amine oxidase N-terminal domain-containing protein, partial [Bacillota bacterium]|nr:copper amine oxidase N-terminal domain-containing protein [Bacillota bacterium]